jgi:RsiW-degrading membrane proteinase PrsW (M82 family)
VNAYDTVMRKTELRKVLSLVGVSLATCVMFLGLRWGIKLVCDIFVSPWSLVLGMFLAGLGIVLASVVFLVVEFYYPTRWRGER